MPNNKHIEELARQLHDWYLEATRELGPENYNQNAQRHYDELSHEQREIDRYIAKKVAQALQTAREERDKEIVGLIQEIKNTSHHSEQAWYNALRCVISSIQKSKE